MDEFGTRIEKALELAKKDRKALAQHLEVSVQAVGQAIRGGKFSAKNAAKAARFLGVNWYWLATGEETPAVPEGVRLTEEERAVLERVLLGATVEAESQAKATAPSPAQRLSEAKKVKAIEPKIIKRGKSDATGTAARHRKP